MRPFFRTILAGVVTALWVGMPLAAFAQAGISDPVLTDISALPEAPGPNDEVDFIVSYGNAGDLDASNAELIIDYNENRLEQISLGDTEHCQDDSVVIRCFFDDIPAKSSSAVSFTATVTPTLQRGADIMTIAYIEEVGNPSDIIQNNYKNLVLTASGAGRGIVGQAGLPAEIGIAGGVSLEEPSKSQGVTLFDVTKDPNWRMSGLSTAGLKFMIRGKEALAWALNIRESGFDSPAIQEHYLKVLTVVNSLFILGLLVIAGLWMFSLLIPRRYLRQVILVYALAVLFVNFALPLNRLLIDGSGLLQNAFMNGVDITGIAETPVYNDKNAVGYQNETDAIQQKTDQTINIHLPPDEGHAAEDGVVIGKLRQSFLSPMYTGTIIGGDSDQTLQLLSTGNDTSLELSPNRAIELSGERAFNPDEENVWFAFIMMALTGLAYFGMALIFIARIVMLWALMIVSPVLLLLVIFRATRGYFANWIGLYARWLLIGPLLALGLAIVVGIWRSVGLPVTSAYPGAGGFGVLTNIGFFLPGSRTANTLSTTPQMMEYILFLVMLYLPILFAFALTRQKTLAAVATVFSEKREERRLTPSSVAPTAPTVEKKEKETEGFGRLGGLLGERFARFVKPPTSATVATAPPIESAVQLSPEHLALSPIRELMGLSAGEKKGSRTAHQNAVEHLASPSAVADPIERRKLTAVRQEIFRRADQGDPEAVAIAKEIRERETQISSFMKTERVTEKPVVTGGAPTVVATSPPVTVREKVEAPAPTVTVIAPKEDVKIQKPEPKIVSDQKEKEKLLEEPGSEGNEKKKEKDEKEKTSDESADTKQPPAEQKSENGSPDEGRSSRANHLSSETP